MEQDWLVAVTVVVELQQVEVVLQQEVVVVALVSGAVADWQCEAESPQWIQ